MVGSVLLIEDVRFTRALTRRMISDFVHGEVHEAADVSEAMEILRLVKDIEIIVTDISMPGMNGLEFLKLIRTGKTTTDPNIPFFIISGAVTEPVRRALEQLDVTAILNKPAHREDLENEFDKISQASVSQVNPARYQGVKIEGLLDDKTQEAPQQTARFDGFDERLRFLETVPDLEGLDTKDRKRLAELAELLHFAEDTEIEPSVFASNRLLIIAQGEAEVLRSTHATASETIAHRIDLLEAGNLLGITAFMSLPGEAEHSQIRTTRPTDVLAFDFSKADNDPELGSLLEHLKLSIGRTLAHRLTQSDAAIAENLAHRLAEAKIKRTAGGFVIMKVSALAIFTLTMRFLPDLDFKGPDRTLASIVMTLVAFFPFLITVRNGPFRFSDLGLTFKGARAAIAEALLFSSVFLALLILLKFLAISILPGHQGGQIFEYSSSFIKTGPQGELDMMYYALNIGLFALFVPIQEVIVRCGLQSLIREFLYGSDRYRTFVSIWVSNLMFAASNTHLNVGFAIAVFIGGLFWGWLFSRRRSIVGVSLSHIIVGGMSLFALGLENFI
ncbi:MAG: response regulator [Deltaproteobacteria bacterium]|nr:response regulator [Deltaproteobacteria bacterium]